LRAQGRACGLRVRRRLIRNPDGSAFRTDASPFAFSRMYDGTNCRAGARARR